LIRANENASSENATVTEREIASVDRLLDLLDHRVA
jgi:hypothetical protein